MIGEDIGYTREEIKGILGLSDNELNSAIGILKKQGAIRISKEDRYIVKGDGNE